MSMFHVRYAAAAAQIKNEETDFRWVYSHEMGFSRNSIAEFNLMNNMTN
jgi:hypothetical protein